MELIVLCLNNQVNLSACPDHYVLRPFGQNELEVIETTGNSPFPVRFFIVFGDETGLKTPRDKSYQYQSTGVARMKDGTTIGGVRHQFKNTDTGIEVSLVVEFPALCPNSLIKSHQMHLACEFSYWLQWIKDHKNNFQINNSQDVQINHTYVLIKPSSLIGKICIICT